MTAVLDSSAILAWLWQEKGHEVVASYLPDAMVSTVNLAEVNAKCQERGIDLDAARNMIGNMQLTTVSYDEQQAFVTGGLRAQTVRAGLSLGDRACLSLGMLNNTVVITADGVWQSLGLTVSIILIR